MSSRAVVIGGGFGGIAAALRLRARGYDVTLLEKQNQLGGRATVYRRDGFTFDAGPTVVTAPFLFDELFQLFGKRREDYVRFVSLYPWYRIVFHDGRFFDYGGSIEQMQDQIRKFNPDDCAGYLRFLQKSKKIFDIGFTQLGDKPFNNIMSMLRCAPQMATLGAWRTVWQMASKYFHDENLRRVFSFQPLLVGGNPFNTTSIYSLIHYLEREYGVHFAMGGTTAIVSALEKLMLEQGIQIRTSTEVKEINLSTPRWKTRRDPDTGADVYIRKSYHRIVRGVILSDGEVIDADAVVCNADAPFVYKNLIPAGASKEWKEKRIDKLKYSMGLFVFYFGTTKKFPDVQHHTILLGEKYQSLLHEMFDLKKLEMSDFSVYLHRPTATDLSLAPPNCDAFYVLVPVPNLQGKIDWKEMGPKYRDLIVDYLERKILPGLKQCITSESFVTPQFFQDELNTLHGSGFSIQPTFGQSAYFRFHNQSDEFKNLYFVGAATHPGAGMPGVLCSAKVLEHVLP